MQNPMEGRQARIDPFDPLTNHLGMPAHASPADPSAEFKANVFRKFDLNMISPESAYMAQNPVPNFMSKKAVPLIPINFESVDVLVVGDETEI